MQVPEWRHCPAHGKKVTRNIFQIKLWANIYVYQFELSEAEKIIKEKERKKEILT